MRLTIIVFSFMMSITAVTAQYDLVPTDKQEEYSHVIEDMFQANACAKRLGLKKIYLSATKVFVAFLKHHNFPDAENLGRTTAAEIAEKVDGSAQIATEASCSALAERISKVAVR